MKTKLLIGGALLIALLIGGGIYLAQPEQATAPETEAVATAVVENVEANPATTTENINPEVATTNTTPTTQQPTQAAPKPQAPTTPPVKKSPPLPYSAVITYDGGKFVPEEVTIIEGGTVRFVNQSDIGMWIASDNHPMHDRYPIKSSSDCGGSSFDQCASVSTGKSWSFTFERVGTWGFHNDERARDTGSVKVMRAEEYLKLLE